MSVPVLGLPNSTKFSPAMLKGRRTAMAAAADFGVTVAAKTYISTLPANTIALIDRIYIKATMPPGATTYTITLTTNAQTIVLVARGTAAVATTEDLSLDPKGNMVIMDGQSLTIQASAGNIFFAQVQYRLMNKLEAITGGYLPGIPFWGSAGSGVTSGSPVDVGTLTPATVDKNRGLEVRGIAITGIQTNAGTGAFKEILVEFTDPAAATHRKLMKNAYANNDTRAARPLIVSRGRFRGPRGTNTANGYGLRATFGETGSNARVAVWGFFYTDAQRTFPGTGVPPASATGAFDAGDYFWEFFETTANLTVQNLFPATTVAALKRPFVIDGMVCAIAADTGAPVDGDVCQLIFADTVKSVTTPTAIYGLGANVDIRQDMDLALMVADQVAISVGTLQATDADKIGFTIWGRFIGNPLSDGHRTDAYIEAS